MNDIAKALKDGQSTGFNRFCTVETIAASDPEAYEKFMWARHLRRSGELPVFRDALRTLVDITGVKVSTQMLRTFFEKEQVRGEEEFYERNPDLRTGGGKPRARNRKAKKAT